MNAGFAATLQGKALVQNKQDLAGARQQRCWARGLMRYATGANPIGQSYVVGYNPSGIAAADRPHHRSASCNPDLQVFCGQEAFTASVGSAHP